MNYFSFTIFLILLLSITTSSKPQSPDEEGKSSSSSRRILHQPLFPASNPPPPPPHADLPDPDQPFFHELPNGPSPDQGPPTPVGNSVAASHAHHTKVGIAAAISISAVVLALAILSALAFYLYNHRSRNHDHSQKLVAADDQSSSLPPPSNFLYIGTVEPSSARTTVPIIETNNASLYRKLHKPGRRSERYRPSPDLQPLPPLPKPPPPPAIHSPPPMSSSDDDDDDNFYTPQGSSMSNESHNNNNNNNNSRVVPQYSKTRTSPKPVMIIPSITKHPPPPPPPPRPRTSSLGPLQPSETLPYTPKRPKFAAPPPPPDMAKLRSISNDDHHHRQTRQIPIPPPPPPPPPPVTRKTGSVVAEPYTPSPVSKQPARPESMSPPSPPSPKAINSGADENDKKGDTKPKLKPLHWDKVRATSERATVWDQLNSSSFQLNEDAMESLFGCNSANSVPKEMANNKKNPALEQENRVLDPKKSQNIAILIRALNVTREEVSEALLDGNPEGLGPDLLETLVKMAPTKEEEIKLKDYKGEISKLGSAERFLKGILDIPFAFKRVEAMLYRANFDTEVAYLRKSFRALEEASEELKNSRLFLKLLEAVLRTGNRMNDGTNRGDARAFKLDTLLKLVDVKGADGKTTLLHFVVQEIIRSEGNENPASFEFKEDEFRKQGLHVVSGLSKELGNVKKSAGMDSDVLSGYVSKLETGLEKVRSVMGYESGQGQKGKFFESMRAFLAEAVGDITRIKSEEKKALSRVIEVTEYFHGDAAKEEAHPLRIFLIVRDFLAILDNVCRDVGRMQVGATMGAGRSFRMPVVN